ncbi:MAG TPA: hypothetical protein VLU73_00665 [Methylococcaceae bacterium]|nr:hypothetical protein [Methylococcaceae bacterium]
MNLNENQTDVENPELSYKYLLDLWTSGIRDFHSLLGDYLTANSIFAAVIGFLLSRQPVTLIISFLVFILCVFGILISLQMAIVLGRFSSQNELWEWQLRGTERKANWKQKKLFEDLYRLRQLQESLHDEGNDPPVFRPNWALRQHRKWWTHRAISFPLFFGIIYGLLIFWDLLQIGK